MSYVRPLPSLFSLFTDSLLNPSSYVSPVTHALCSRIAMYFFLMTYYDSYVEDNEFKMFPEYAYAFFSTYVFWLESISIADHLSSLSSTLTYSIGLVAFD